MPPEWIVITEEVSEITWIVAAPPHLCDVLFRWGLDSDEAIIFSPIKFLFHKEGMFSQISHKKVP